MIFIQIILAVSDAALNHVTTIKLIHFRILIQDQPA